MTLLLIPLLPLLGFLVNAFLGKRLPKSVSGGVACLAIIGSFAVSAASVWSLVQDAGQPWHEETYYRWLASGDLQVPLQFRLDHLSALMILVISGIGALIHIYSTAYMHEETDSEYARYFSYLNLFASFMLILVLGSTFPVMFVGWEGVGLCSYLLIGFWYKKKSAADAGKKAFVVNRIGDFGFLLGTLLVFTQFGSLDFQIVAAGAAARPVETSMGVLTVATLLLFLGATGKSAQIPLYTWLPDAMEGPTPVSALIHAATMVTAGVYMIGRNAVLFQHAPITLAVVAGIGVATALMAGTIGLVQNDIKRVLAYSTVSQLGYMFLAMGVGAYAAGIFHLYTHAFFKALLFLGSGAVIHALAGEQDIRNMGGLRKQLPITYWTFLIGALAIAGIFPLAGFFSKDEILWKTFAGGHRILWAIGMVTAFLTATYMFRLVFLTFHGERRHDAPAPAHPEEEEPAAGHAAGHHLHDAPAPMALALIVLAAGSIVAGFVGVPHALGGHNRIEAFLEPAFEAHAVAPINEFQVVEPGRPAAPDTAAGHGATAPGDAHADTTTELMLMGLSFGLALAGIGIASYFWLRNRRAAAGVARSATPVYTLLLNKYYVDEIYDALIVQPIKHASTLVLWRGADAGLIDGAVNGVGSTIRGGSVTLRRLQTGSIRAYAGSLFLGVVLILGWYLLR
ncbi:MAG TPA: NADH-quinone oxidoreductase subunit L [Vicinamibacterales bacterium]|nr:NADH-quinone oxidoreductase subunit L [Vicinamibacterales bacterium]